MKHLKVVLLAGGVGGAKLAEGLDSVDDVELSIIGNTADDETFHGLVVSPDIDTLTYSLAKMINRAQGWGVTNDEYKALRLLSKFGNETWMQLGDSDFGLHIYRTNRLRLGDRPSIIASDIAKALGIKARIILPSDDCIKTKVKTYAGWISFQEYFVKEKCNEEVLDLKYVGAKEARPTKEVLETLRKADIIVVAPSNPLLSIAPILEISGIRQLIKNLSVPKLAISPLISGSTVKGPAAKIMASMNHRADAYGVAEFYRDFLDVIIIDNKDKKLESEIKSLGVNVELDNILMTNQKEKHQLSKRVIEIGFKLRGLVS